LTLWDLACPASLFAAGYAYGKLSAFPEPPKPDRTLELLAGLFLGGLALGKIAFGRKGSDRPS
jgi:hypothetical protein